MIESFVITIENNNESEQAANKCIESSNKVGNDFNIHKFNAVVPDQVDDLMRSLKLKWTYPWDEPKLDLASGLTLQPYKTAVRKKRVACFLSHYELWRKCAETNEPLIVLEHDAVFTNKLEVEPLLLSKYNIIALNDPRGATRMSQLYHQMVRSSALDIVAVPKIDDDRIPQGLPGNSAYLIKPAGAKKLMYACKQYGAWPNDAIMCKQLLPNQLAVIKNYVTQVQGLRSTTTL